MVDVRVEPSEIRVGGYSPPNIMMQHRASTKLFTSDIHSIVSEMQIPPCADCITLPDRSYKLHDLATGFLGQGAQGCVRIGYDMKTGENVAVKICPFADNSFNEVKALSLVRHPNVVELKGVHLDKQTQSLSIVMELCQGGELFDRIAETGTGLDEPTARRYCQQLAGAMAACHKQGVYHRDLKPENILLSANDDVKVADFGLAATLRSSTAQLAETACGSQLYAAPEVLEAQLTSQKYVASQADVWSFGIILFCMVAGRPPFNHANSSCPLFLIFQKTGKFCHLPTGLSDDILELLSRALRLNPSERLSMDDICASKWLRQQEVAVPVDGATKWCYVNGVGEGPPLPEDGETTPPASSAPTPSLSEQEQEQHTQKKQRTEDSKLAGEEASASSNVGVRCLGWEGMARSISYWAKCVEDACGIMDMGCERDPVSQDLLVHSKDPSGASSTSQFCARVQIGVDDQGYHKVHIRRVGVTFDYHAFYRGLQSHMIGCGIYRIEGEANDGLDLKSVPQTTS